MRKISRSKQFRVALAMRFKEAIDRHLGVPVPSLARQLGYANPTTLYGARRGAGFLDPERIARLATIRCGTGEVIDLHWLMTGQGGPLRGAGRPNQPEAMRKRLIASVSSMSESDVKWLLLVMERGRFPMRRGDAPVRSRQSRK